DVGASERGSFFDDVGLEVAGHVQHDAPRRNRRHMLDAEFLQAVSCRKVAGLVAVVIKIVDADVTQAVDLRADAGPAVDLIVVVRGLRWSKRGAGVLTRLNYRDGPRARRIGRCISICLDSEPVGSTFSHEARGS